MGAFPLPNGRGSDFLALIPYIFATPSLRTIGELIQRAELSIAALAASVQAELSLPYPILQKSLQKWC